MFKHKNKKLTLIFLTAILAVLIGGSFVVGVKKAQASSTSLEGATHDSVGDYINSKATVPLICAYTENTCNLNAPQYDSVQTKRNLKCTWSLSSADVVKYNPFDIIIKYIGDDNGTPIGKRCTGVTQPIKIHENGDRDYECIISDPCFTHILGGAYASHFEDIIGKNAAQIRGHYSTINPNLGTGGTQDVLNSNYTKITAIALQETVSPDDVVTAQKKLVVLQTTCADTEALSKAGGLDGFWQNAYDETIHFFSSGANTVAVQRDNLKICEQLLTSAQSLVEFIKKKAAATTAGKDAGKTGADLDNYVKDATSADLTKLGTDLSKQAKDNQQTTQPAGPALSNPDGKCTGDGYKEDMMQLIKPFPAGMMCFVESKILGGLNGVFTSLGELFKNVLLVNNKTLLSTNAVVITVSDIFVNFINGLFFIVALLSILITTLKIDIPALSLNTWQLKRMVPTIIITMIFVNYSLSIANLVISIMDWLVGQFASIDAGQFFAFNTDMWNVDGIRWGVLWFRILFLVAFLLITLYLLCLLWLRKIVLIVLYMFAPVPYLAYIIPVEAIKKQTGAWWGQFMNWGLMGPMVAIFLFAAAKSIAVSFDAVPLPSDVANSVPAGGLSFTNMILVGVLLYMAATVPLKLGGTAMSAVQKQTTGRAGKMASKGAKSIGTGVAKSAKTAGYNIAAGEGRLGKIPGMKQIAGAAITAGRTPAMLRAKQDAKLGAAKKAADDKLAGGRITQKMTSNPLVKDDVDKARDKFMTSSPKQVMESAVDAMKKGDRNKTAGAFKALQDQSQSMDPKVSQAAQEQITQLKNATGIDLATAKPDLATVQTAVKWAQNSNNQTKVNNLKRGFLGGNANQMAQDLSTATHQGAALSSIAAAGAPGNVGDFVDTLSESQLDTIDRTLPQYNAELSDSAIKNNMIRMGVTGVSEADVRAGTAAVPAGNVAFGNYQRNIAQKTQAAATAKLISNERESKIKAREKSMVEGYLNDADPNVGHPERARVFGSLGNEVTKLEGFISGGHIDEARKLASNMFGGPGADSSAWSTAHMSKLAKARRDALTGTTP